jgi:hypothetical protein
MSSTPSTSEPVVPDRFMQTPQETGWAGWVVFASSMMIIVGAFHAIQGLVALLDDEYYLVGSEGLTIQLDFTMWGWVHLVGGTVVVLAGGALLVGQTWARGVGIALAIVSAITSFTFIAAYPVWCTIVIALDVVVIYALAVHGRELRTRP